MGDEELASFIGYVSSTLDQYADRDHPKHFNYSMDYLVYSASKSITEEPIIWDMDYANVIKRSMFQKFDNYVQYEIDEYMKKRTK